MQRLSYLARDALDAAHRLHIELLRRELYGGIARVNTGKLDVLADGVCQYVAVLGHGVHLYLLGMLDKLRHYHGVILRHIGGQLQKSLQLLIV